MTYPRCVGLWVALLAFSLGTSVIAQATELPGERVQFRNRLTAAERSFLRTTPGLKSMRQELDESLRKRRVYWAEIDLNADRMPERIVIVEHPATCGTSGCMASIFAWRDGHWKFDSGISGEHKTFSILPETDLGWRRLHNGDIPYFRLPCGYFSQEVIDDDASVGSNPCRND